MSKSVDGRAGEPAPLTRRQAIELVHDPLNELAMRFQQACAKWSAATPDGSMANILLAASALLASPPSAGPASAGVRAAAPPAELVALLRSGGSANYALAPVLRARDDHVSAEQCTADARRMYDLANEMESPAVSPLLPSVTGEPMLAYLRSMLTCPDEQYPLYAHILLENVERIIAFIEAPAVPLAQQGAGSTGAPLDQPTARKPDAWGVVDVEGDVRIADPIKHTMDVACEYYSKDHGTVQPLYLGASPGSGAPRK